MVQTFKELVNKMVEIYGVASYLNNEDDIEAENYWFKCPECDEPILEADWTIEELKHHCPVCEYEWEEDLE